MQRCSQKYSSRLQYVCRRTYVQYVGSIVKYGVRTLRESSLGSQKYVHIHIKEY